MNERAAMAGAWFALGVAVVAVVVAVGAPPANAAPPTPPPALRVTSVVMKEGARLDARILEACDVAKLVTDEINRYRAPRPKKRGAVVPTTEIALRIDRVARVAGMPPNVPGGTDVGVSVLAVGGKETGQLFLCRAAGFKSIWNPSHCERISYCGTKLAEQISTWLTWQAREPAP